MPSHDENTNDFKDVRVIECEVYSRVSGYFRPVNGWNIGKKQEFEDRRFMKFRNNFKNLKKS
jgi:anaerobic ribonucleoside-triphosphate reductase